MRLTTSGEKRRLRSSPATNNTWGLTMPRFLLGSVVLAFLSVFSSSVSAAPITIDFDNLSELDSVTTQYAGVTFTDATVLTAGSTVNEIEFPPHSGSNVVFDDGGPMTLSFSAPIYSFTGFFTYGTALTLSAFDGANNLLSSVTSAFGSNDAAFGDPGSSPNELLSFASLTGISSILISGDLAGGSFVLDDVSFDSSRPTGVPEPATGLLVAAGLSILAIRKRNQLPVKG